MNARMCVSQPYWYDVERNAFEKAGVCFGPCQNDDRVASERCPKCVRYNETAWFDRLFRGAISLPETHSVETHPENELTKPLTILIAGSPGTGKTTLCSEICYNLAQKENGKHNSLYASTESETENIISNFKSYGYDDADLVFDNYETTQAPAGKSGKVFVYGRERFSEIRDQNDIMRKLQRLFSSAMRTMNPDPKIGNEVFQQLWNLAVIKPLLKKDFKWPYALVFDSLNIMPVENASNYINEIIKQCSGVKVLFLILDASANHKEYRIWEHFCDIVVRLDFENRSGYYTRTMEVVKARYQSHIWGKHPFKISRPYTGGDDRDIRRRSHPYRERGGIFIYPSIHYFLSEYKHMEPPTEHELCDTLPKALNKMLLQQHEMTRQRGGFPEGRCTAFVGERGGHKSHLAYLHMLHRINEGECGLVISLRDDENMTRNTMSRIYSDFKRRNFKKGTPLENIKEMETQGKLEILYFHPGYVTPEEFFHRVFIAVQKLKRTCKKSTVMFNSLDQLNARFPLCAKEDMFIPGLINFLTAEQTTSIFIAVPEEKGQPATQYGLLPMADLILSFNRKKIETNACREAMTALPRLSEKTKRDINTMFDPSVKPYVEEIVLEVVRFSGGQRAGACGMLELINQDSDKLVKLKGYYDRPGLHFTEFSDRPWEYHV